MSNTLHKGVPFDASNTDILSVPQKDVQDDDYSTLPLPSGGVFYPKDVKNIYVRRFDVLDIDKMSSAKKAAKMGDYIRAIGATITVPIEMLTQDDFQFLCFWHRVNSYPTRPLKLNWKCNNENHLRLATREKAEGMTEDELDDIEDSKKFLNNTVTLKASGQIEVGTMTVQRFEKLRAWLSNPERHTKDFIFMPPVVGDLIEFSEIAQAELRHLKIEDLDTNPENLELVLDEINSASEDDILIRIACNLNAKFGATLADRINYVKSTAAEDRRLFGTEFISDLEEFEELSQHSVKESCKGVCGYRGCKQAVNLAVEFDLFNFFPWV